jgi:hypothetical protein
MSRVQPGAAGSASRCCSATAARTLSGTPRYQPQSSCRSWTTPTIPRRTSTFTSRRPILDAMNQAVSRLQAYESADNGKYPAV